jgi:hypothetical protein
MKSSNSVDIWALGFSIILNMLYCGWMLIFAAGL